MKNKQVPSTQIHALYDQLFSQTLESSRGALISIKSLSACKSLNLYTCEENESLL